MREILILSLNKNQSGEVPDVTTGFEDRNKD